MAELIIFPSASGSRSGWTLTSGTDAHAMVGDDPHDSDTTRMALGYNAFGVAVVGHAAPSLGTIDSITSVAITHMMRRGTSYNASGNRPYWNMGGVSLAASSSYITATGNQDTFTTSYAAYTWTDTVNPKSGLAWTQADIERTGDYTNWLWGWNIRVQTGPLGSLYCTQSFLTITYEAGASGPVIPVFTNQYRQRRN